MTAEDKPLITPRLRVGELLEAYPEVEQVLCDLAPPFRKLRNPVLRRTVAKVVTLEKAAAVAGVPIGKLIRTLREAVGQAVDAGEGVAAAAPEPAGETPEWVREAEVAEVLNADEMLASGEHPLGRVQQSVRQLQPGQCVVIRGTFRPEPLIELLTGQGCRVHVNESAEQVETWVMRA